MPRITQLKKEREKKKDLLCCKLACSGFLPSKKKSSAKLGRGLSVQLPTKDRFASELRSWPGDI